MTAPEPTPAPGPPSGLTITQVVIDLETGLFAFKYADGITEHMQIRDHTELPTVSAFLTALTAEIARFGRPQRRTHGDDPSVTK